MKKIAAVLLCLGFVVASAGVNAETSQIDRKFKSTGDFFRWTEAVDRELQFLRGEIDRLSHENETLRVAARTSVAQYPIITSAERTEKDRYEVTILNPGPARWITLQFSVWTRKEGQAARMHPWKHVFYLSGGIETAHEVFVSTDDYTIASPNPRFELLYDEDYSK